MNSRIKFLRLSLGLSQEELATKIGISSRAHISALESGKRNVTDRIISDICREFNVNEAWLRTGEGDMFIEIPEDDELAAYCGDICAGKDEWFAHTILTYMRLDDDSKQVIRNFIESLNTKNQDQE